MAETEVLFYIIIVVVILVKLIFWCLYLCTKNRRLRRLRQRQAQAEANAVIDPTCFEEVPAIPQPAFVFTGMSMTLPNTDLIESLPEYQADDPFKTDQPPPSYIDICNAALTTQELQSFANMEVEDTQRLIADENESSYCIE